MRRRRHHDVMPAIRYGEAIEIYERVSAASLDVALLKWSVKGEFPRAAVTFVIC